MFNIPKVSVGAIIETIEAIFYFERNLSLDEIECHEANFLRKMMCFELAPEITKA